ncbi:Gfo/Idh/MocA family protein [Limisphaera ngatamarikiensis]|uniref:Gfo/Idh/MocA family protein n=1 Tax=Limisphaera ngatamarikiensis TaxID=1324935 RepID=UPI00197F3D2D|nr:Gfo/Idh/MocA family oxidoreductase [Limisphaera ngatamarikiensis]
MMKQSFSLAQVRSSAARGVSRRTFLRRGVVAAAAAWGLPQILPRSVLGAPGRPGPNEQIGIGFIGMGRQAGNLLQGLLRLPEARIVAVADVNLPRAQAVTSKHGGEAYQDFRRLLDRKDVDAIITATPEHWRAYICISACQAGKDVYAEKPVSLTIRDGRLIVQAARKYNRVFQVGSQQRSMWIDIEACNALRRGDWGKIQKVLYMNYPTPWECALPEQKIPDGLDWDMWCGPTPVVPYNEDLYLPRANPGWLSFRPYSGGEMTGWGSHGFDMIQMALGMDDSGPVEVWIEGEKLVPPVYTKPEPKDRGDRICSQARVFFRYANGVVLEPSEDPKPPGFGAIFITDRGRFRVDRGRVESDPEEYAIELLKRRPRGFDDDHLKNWLDCIKTRQRPNADVEIGHRSATVCHLGNIARWVGRRLRWDPVREIFPDDPEANQYLERERRKPWQHPEKV